MACRVMTAGPRSILITGASSGLGKALACEYATAGVHLALIGRDRQRLQRVATLCRERGSSVATGLVDVRDRRGLAAWIHSADDSNPIDLAVANAGITAGTGMGRLREHPDLVRNVIETNLVGTINTIDPVVDRMCARGRGRITVLGSIGAIRGFPYCPSYSASKAAVHAYAEALRGAVARQGVGVTIVAPGFIGTPLNADIVCPKPLLMSDERAARIIRRGLDRNRTLIAFPRLLYYGLQLTRLLPTRLTDSIFAGIEVDIPEKFDKSSDG
jgi:NADP-dependent 3-hydroxy acid dehydrogenase YdfG